MSDLDYWREAVMSSCEEHGVSATCAQIDAIAADISGSHENYGMAFYRPENPLRGENETLRAELAKERSKVGCPDCRGSGRLKYNSGPWGINTQCHRCRGEGKVQP